MTTTKNELCLVGRGFGAWLATLLLGIYILFGWPGIWSLAGNNSSRYLYYVWLAEDFEPGWQHFFKLYNFVWLAGDLEPGWQHFF